MQRLLPVFATLYLLMPVLSYAQEPKPVAPVRKITPGKVILPTERMRRIWGELVSVDLTTRTGKFRNEGNDEVMSFTVMPYAELLHHAANGDLQDFRVGERAIFRLHENEQGDRISMTISSASKALFQPTGLARIWTSQE